MDLEEGNLSQEREDESLGGGRIPSRGRWG